MSTKHRFVRPTFGAVERKGLTRRAVLQSTAIGGALGGLSSVARANPGNDLVKKTFLIDATGYGINEDMWAEYDIQCGYNGFLEWQLAHDTVPDPHLVRDLRLDNWDFADVWWDLNSPWQAPVEHPNIAWALGQPPLFARMSPGAWALMYYTTVQEQALLGYRSRRQLYWRMAEFWQNVHNTFCLPIIQRPSWNDFFRDNIAKNALGYYGNLVTASGQGASMLFYLNQISSTSTSPIENYARELLELHTVGVDDGDQYHPAYTMYPTFTEADIVPVAEIFTGWNLDLVPTQQRYGRFFFDATKHKQGAKFVPFMNKTYADTGVGQGLELIADLAGRPPSSSQPGIRPHVLTAFHMAKRLMEWFLCDDALAVPYRDHTYRVAAAFWASFGNIKEAVRMLFKEQYFSEFHSDDTFKVRDPLKLTTAVMRAIEPSIAYPNIEWAKRLQKLGRLTASHPSPDGYSNHTDAWTASMMARFEYVHDAVYSHNNMGWTIAPSRLAAIFPASVSRYGYGQRLNELFAGSRVHDAEIEAMHAYLDQLNQPSGPYQNYDLQRESLVFFFSLPRLQGLL